MPGLVYDESVTRDTAIEAPVILFGAFDRHNFGDLLFPHLVEAMLPGKRLVFAGLAPRDLRCYGGHRVRPLAQLAAEYREQPVHILHVGGELLTCDAWQAAVMLLPPDQAQEVITRLDRQQQQAREWARGQLGISALAPYTVSRQLFPAAATVVYNAVGGVDLAERDPALRIEVLENLKAADVLSVRDRQTWAALQAGGIAARLMPDPAVMVAELFGATIRRQALEGETAHILTAFPQGYVAVQFSADFGDDATLRTIAAQLDRIADSLGVGVVLFRAGAAPWHDDLRCYEQVAACMRNPAVKLFTSLHLWDICALIAGSRAYAGSSLHGRIVAAAFALPRLSLRPPFQSAQSAKLEAFTAAWEVPGLPATVCVRQIAQGVHDALAADPAQLQHAATELAAQYRAGFAAIRAALQ